MKLRKHRGSLADSMSTVVEVEGTVASLVEVIAREINRPDLDASAISVEPYGVEPDWRTGWQTYLVGVEGWGVYGFTDGPVRVQP